MPEAAAVQVTRRVLDKFADPRALVQGQQLG